MIQTKVFFNVDSLNAWLKDNDDLEFLKFYSNGPQYFFVVYDDARPSK